MKLYNILLISGLVLMFVIPSIYGIETSRNIIIGTASLLMGIYLFFSGYNLRCAHKEWEMMLGDCKD